MSKSTDPSIYADSAQARGNEARMSGSKPAVLPVADDEAGWAEVHPPHQ